MQVRDGTTDLWAIHQHDRANPDIMGAENFRPVPRGSFHEIQAKYAGQMTLNPVRLAHELFGTSPRDRRFNLYDNTAEKLPTLTMGSGWLKQSLEANYQLNNNARPLFNTARTWGS